LRCGLVKILAREVAVTPNQVTVARIGTAFLAVALFSSGGHVFAVDVTAIALTVAAMALDGVDGYLARARGLATPLGAKFDVLGDRVVENLFFTCFAASGLISLWVPVLFFGRGALTDFLSGLAVRAGFGQNPMGATRWGRSLVASRTSRAGYAALKCVCFCYLGFLLSLRHMAAPNRWSTLTGAGWLVTMAQAITLLTVVFCIVRAIPVVWEGRRYLTGVPKGAAAVLGR
jgi:CDP-diacylglycerol---glycerol-3-phosphate 3-phosphatidyltransferase